MLWPKYCITKVNKVLYNKVWMHCITKVNKDVWPKYCITKVNKWCMYYYKSKQSDQSIVLQSKQRCMTKVLYYKSKQRCYDQSIALQK